MALTPLITAGINATRRDDYNGWVGFQFTANQNLVITALGRQWQHGAFDDTPANNKTVKLWTNAGVELGAVTITPSSVKLGQFQYELLGAPVNLTSGQSYRVASLEVLGSGDRWSDQAPFMSYDSSIGGFSGAFGPGSYPSSYAVHPFVAPNLYVTRQLSDNLQGWWCPSLDTSGNGTTTLTDLSGNGNNGTLTNMDAATDWVADTSAGGVRALDFDGVSQSVQMANAALPLTGDFTLSVWFLYRDNEIGAVVSQYTLGVAGRTSIVINQNAIGFKQSNTLNFYSNPGLTASTTGLATNTWFNIVLQRSSNKGFAYVNGTLVATDSDWSTAIEDTAFALGVSVSYLNGRIDATAIWDRALTSDEVSQLYNGGRSLKLVDLSTGLQGWWCPSRDTSGNGTTTLTDLSGNGNNGTLTNMDAATDWVADTDNGGVRALDLDGGDDLIVVANNPGAFASGQSFSVAGWIKSTMTGSNNSTALIGDGYSPIETRPW